MRLPARSLAAFVLLGAGAVLAQDPPGASGPMALDGVVGASGSRALTRVTWPNRDGHASVVFQDRLWLLGGWSHFIGGTSVNDLWSSGG